MCCKKTNTNGMSPRFAPHACTIRRPHRCERHFECRMCCKNQYKGGANNNNDDITNNKQQQTTTNNSSSSNNSRMYETSATPMRKALGVTASLRSSRVYVNVGANNNSSNNNNNPFQRLRWPEAQNPRFSSMPAGKRSINSQIRRLSWICGFPPISACPTEKLGLEFLLPNSAYKMYHLH